MRRCTAGVAALVAGFVFVVANAAGASASPNLAVSAVSINAQDIPFGCCGGNDSYELEDFAGSTATLVGTLNAGGHTFIGVATMQLGVFGLVSCNGSSRPLETCTGSGSAAGTISGSGVGSINGTCSANGTIVQQSVVVGQLVSQATLPFVCSISFSGSAPQSVAFSAVLVWLAPTGQNKPGVGIAVG